jgi:hypothetical protein
MSTISTIGEVGRGDGGSRLVLGYLNGGPRTETNPILEVVLGPFEYDSTLIPFQDDLLPAEF